MAGSGQQILASDFVAIQDKAQEILGTGVGSKGYGQIVQSADVYSGNQISKAQWDALRYDIINIKFHQTGTVPDIVTVNVGDPIAYGASAPNTSYNTILDSAIANRFDIAANQSVISAAGTTSYSSNWQSALSTVLTVTFTTANEARFFFNSGGKIRITTGLTGGSGTAQVNAWKYFLTSAGTIEFGANTNPSINYYTLTNSFQEYHKTFQTTPYSANNYKLEVRSNVADNSSGTATTLYIRITLTDSYTDPGPSVPPGDIVDGTLTVSVEELKASGSMVPSGTFSVVSPLYSFSSFTVA